MNEDANKSRRVLLTGGTGLIGRALCKTLIEAGMDVVVLSRHPELAYGRLPHGVAVQGWDARTLGDWVKWVGEVDVIVNLAGESIAGENTLAVLTRRWTKEQKSRIRESRLRAGALLVEAMGAAARKPSVFVQASAVGYYGNRRDEVVDEETQAGEGFLADVCRAWEKSTEEVTQWGVRRVVIRTGLVLASQGGILPLMLLPLRLFVGGKLGDGRQYLPWIHLDDEVEAIRFLIEEETLNGVFNLSAPNPVTQATFVQIAGRLLHRPAWMPTPAFLLKLALGEKAALVLEGQRVLPKRLLGAGFTFRFQELEPALQDLLEKPKG